MRENESARRRMGRERGEARLSLGFPPVLSSHRSLRACSFRLLLFLLGKESCRHGNSFKFVPEENLRIPYLFD